MKAIKIMTRAMLSMLLLGAVVSCEKSYNEPAPFEPVVMEATHTVAQLKAMFSTTPSEITKDVVLKVQVISNDKYGNFYRDLYVQDATGGLKISVGVTGLYNEYPVGTELYVKAKGLTYGAYNGTFGIGAKSTEEKYEYGYLFSRTWIEEVIKCGAKSLPLDTAVITTSADCNDSNLAKLVRLENVTFKKNKDYDTWADAVDKNAGRGGAIEQAVTLGTQEITIRTSNYSKFAGDSVPANGATIDVTGVLTKFGTDWQLSLNTATDVVVK